MSKIPVNLIETIVEMMDEREKAKRAKLMNKNLFDHDLDRIIYAADYYIRANLWLLQSFNNDTHIEIKI